MPSERILLEKQAVVSALAEEMKSAQTIVLADYRGLTVAEDTELRNGMRAEGVNYKVIKNRLAILAAREAGLAELETLLKGPTAMAYSDTDPVGPAKMMDKYAEKFKLFEVKGGAMDGAVASLEKLTALAKIPPLETLRAQVVCGIASPLTGLAILVKAIADKCEEAGAETAAAVYEGKKVTEETVAE